MPDHNPTLSAAARERFPRGLVQPASGFRFSVDALLLASFARIKGARGLDLGCGCGVVGLGLLLRHPERGFTMHGLDLNPDMVAAARSNAALLGFGERYTAELADLGDLGDVTDPAVVPAEIGPALAPESFDLVVSNPPYRRPGQGRDCPDPGKSLGRFESGAGLPDFTRAAGRLLRNRGRAAFVFPAERLADLLLALRARAGEAERGNRQRRGRECAGGEHRFARP